MLFDPEIMCHHEVSVPQIVSRRFCIFIEQLNTQMETQTAAVKPKTLNPIQVQ